MKLFLFTLIVTDYLEDAQLAVFDFQQKSKCAF